MPSRCTGQQARPEKHHRTSTVGPAQSVEHNTTGMHNTQWSKQCIGYSRDCADAFDDHATAAHTSCTCPQTRHVP
eukprot:1158580-Pelagomonas_calceolata.AAC.6